MADPTPDSVRRPDAGTAKGPTTDRAPTRTETLVARRAAESRATVPDVTLTTEVDMETAVARRPELIAAEHALDALVIRATATALRAFPQANGAWRDARVVAFARVNVGLAVPVGDTLVVPTVLDADEKSATTIAEELAGLVARVQAGETTQPELSGATFTVANLGVYGTRRFTPVIIPPQAGILGVGALARRPAVHDGAVVARHGLDLTLAADHRVLYGATAARFLERIRQELEGA